MYTMKIRFEFINYISCIFKFIWHITLQPNHLPDLPKAFPIAIVSTTLRMGTIAKPAPID